MPCVRCHTVCVACSKTPKKGKLTSSAIQQAFKPISNKQEAARAKRRTNFERLLAVEAEINHTNRHPDYGFMRIQHEGMHQAAVKKALKKHAPKKPVPKRKPRARKKRDPGEPHHELLSLLSRR